MKALAIIALLLGLGAIGASVFAKVETYPNFTSLSASLKSDGPSTKFDLPLLADYAKTLQLMHLLAFAAGGLALLLGAIAFVVQKKAGREEGLLPVLAIVTGIAGAGLTVLSAPPWL